MIGWISRRVAGFGGLGSSRKEGEGLDPTSPRRDVEVDPEALETEIREVGDASA